MEALKPKQGRPKLQKEKRKACFLSFRLTASELEALKSAGGAGYRSWARGVILHEAANINSWERSTEVLGGP